MEKVLAVENISSLERLFSKEFSRVYFGAETCEQKIPSEAEVKKAIAFCKENNVGFSLMTCFCTDFGLEKLQKLFPLLSEKDELVANDFGVLNEASKYNFKLVVGRLLNRQFRDPRIISFKGKFPEGMINHLSLSQASSPGFRGLLKGFNVSRVEFDNCLQGIGTSLKETGFFGSIYSPIVFVAATRMCLLANSSKLSSFKKVGIFPCSKECLGKSFRLDSKDFKKQLLLIGNGLFFENKKLPSQKELEQKGIDRIVTNTSLMQSE